MGPTKKELKKQMELLKKQQEEQEQEDSDEIDQEEEDDFEDGGDIEEQEIDGEENEDDDLEDGDDDEEEDDEELDEEGEAIPKLQPNSKLPRKLPNDKSDDEEDEDMEAKAKEQYMMGLKGQPDQAILNMKINDILHILSKFKENSKDGRTRQSYLEELTEYFMQYYNYNRDLVQLFMTMFNPNELVQFFESNEQQRPLTIRTNTLKTRRKELAQILIQRGVNLDSLAEWTKVGLKIYDSKVPIGATPEYLAGHYMLQSASSFLPVIALAPQPNEKILDMAAAPGGKTTYIAQLMKNTGVLYANDVKADRNKALIFNVQRMGINNCIVTNYDGRKLNKVIRNCDRVLLDAPCTGLGIIARDPSVKATKQLIDVQKHAHLQRELILSAIDCCKKGGYIVYSTCSVTVQENENVVDYALKNRFVKLVDMGIEVGEEGYTKYQDKRFDPQLKKTRRILPHVHNMDGFYVAKLKKLENGPRSIKSEVVNDNLDALENEEVENNNVKKNNKDNKLKIKKGQQGVIEVTANGEDYDWNEENESEEKEEVENKEQKKQDKKDQKKSKGEKKVQQNETQVKKQDNKQEKKEENNEKKLSKKEKKLAQKAQEKKEKQNSQVQQQEENEDAEEEEEAEVEIAKEQKQDKQNGQKKQNQKNTEKLAKQPLKKQQDKNGLAKPPKNNQKKEEDDIEEEDVQEEEQEEQEEKQVKEKKDFKKHNNFGKKNSNGGKNQKFNKFNKNQKNKSFNNKFQGKNNKFQKNKKVKTQ